MQRQTAPADEVVVVIDYNKRLLQRTRAALKGIVVLANRETPGLSGARNTGLAAARGEIVAFLDDDAIAEADWLERLVEGYDGDTVAVGGAIIPRWQTRRPAWFPEEFDWVVGCSYRGLPQTAAKVRNVIGANMSFRRDVFGHLGGFPVGMGRVAERPIGCEETDLCLRVNERWPEKVILYSPKARVWHTVREDRATWSYFIARCYGEGMSKAVLARIRGTGPALESERNYLRKTLLRAAGRGVVDVVRGDLTGAGRVGAVACGVLAAAAGYIRARILRLDTLATSPGG